MISEVFEVVLLHVDFLQFAEFLSECTGVKKAKDFNEFKLSLRGATGLAHDAVSTLLRLPVLTELDVSGCSRISAMDKMRLVAKVRLQHVYTQLSC